MTIPVNDTELAEIDRAARARELPRAAYVRLAVKRLMEEDAVA